MSDVVAILKDIIPSKSSLHNAVEFVLTNVDGSEQPVMMIRGVDF